MHMPGCIVRASSRSAFACQWIPHVRPKSSMNGENQEGSCICRYQGGRTLTHFPSRRQVFDRQHQQSSNSRFTSEQCKVRSFPAIGYHTSPYYFKASLARCGHPTTPDLFIRPINEIPPSLIATMKPILQLPPQMKTGGAEEQIPPCRHPPRLTLQRWYA